MKKVSKVFACIAAGVSLVAAALCTGCTGMYSEDQHMQRITARAEERFLGEGSEYTGLEVYPLYNEYDELEYALIELEPQGFVYVCINDQPWLDMYAVPVYFEPNRLWRPYVFEEGVVTTIVNEETGKQRHGKISACCRMKTERITGFMSVISGRQISGTNVAT